MNQTTSTPVGFSFSKLLPALLALAAPLAFAASCTGGDATPEPELVETVAEAATTCQCNKTTITCPADNDCGSWLCSKDILCQSCVFEPKRKEGDKCRTASDKGGVCVKDEKGNGLICCDGCVDKNGVCQSGNSVAACGVAGGACDVCKGDACNEAYCNKEGKCDVQPTNEGGDCSDGNACTVADKCSKGVCKGGSALNCSDGNPCTVDVCNPASGCTTHDPVPNDPPVSCNDGNFCTGPDQCVNGTCTGATIVCDDFKPCTDDLCNPATGCTHPSKAENAACNDGSSCTTGETCQDDDNDPSTPLNCKSDDGEPCNGGNPCIDPDCSGGVCPTEPVFLDGNACQTSLCIEGETCSAGNCQGGQPKNCDDGNPCTIDTCNEATGCLNVPVPSGTTVLCDDANPCTSGDRCDGDTCRGTEIECAPLDSCHKAGKCNEDDGMCSDPRQPNGTTCDITGECQEGVCIGGTVVTPGEGGANGEGGADGTAGGENASGGSAGEGSGATSSGGNASTDADPNKQGGIYVRDPGGCSCSVPGTANERRAGGALGLLFVAGASFLRRRRTA